MSRCIAFSAGCLLVSGGAIAQAITPGPDNPLVVPVPPPLADVVVLKAGTEVVIETLSNLTSRTSKPGDRFGIRLAAPIVDNEREIVPAGLVGEGEVIHAKRGGIAGKAGEFIGNARYVDCGSVRLPLGHLKLLKSGADRSADAIVAAAIFTPGFMFVLGGEVVIPAGTHASAKLTANVTITKEAAAKCHSPASSFSAPPQHQMIQGETK